MNNRIITPSQLGFTDKKERVLLQKTDLAINMQNNKLVDYFVTLSANNSFDLTNIPVHQAIVVIVKAVGEQTVLIPNTTRDIVAGSEREVVIPDGNICEFNIYYDGTNLLWQYNNEMIAGEIEFIYNYIDGEYSDTPYDNEMDMGDSSTTSFDNVYDGGNS